MIFDDYYQNIGCALIAKIDWSKPIFSWFVLRYNGFVVKRNSASKPVLSFIVNQNGYFFRSKNIVCSWKNAVYHDRGAFGLPCGFLIDVDGKVIAKAIRSRPIDPSWTNGIVSYDLFNIVIDESVFKLKLEIETHLGGVVKGDVHLCMYDGSSNLLFKTTKNGRYNDIFIVRNNDHISILFPVFFSFFFNLPWIDL